MVTLTELQRERRSWKYINKDARTRVYRALYGIPAKPDDKDGPEGNQTRAFPQGHNYEDAKYVFIHEACKGDQLVSNGLFPDARFNFLASRLENLKRWKRGENQS